MREALTEEHEADEDSFVGSVVAAMPPQPPGRRDPAPSTYSEEIDALEDEASVEEVRKVWRRLTSSTHVVPTGSPATTEEETREGEEESLVGASRWTTGVRDVVVYAAAFLCGIGLGTMVLNQITGSPFSAEGQAIVHQMDVPGYPKAPRPDAFRNAVAGGLFLLDEDPVAAAVALKEAHDIYPDDAAVVFGLATAGHLNNLPAERNRWLCRAHRMKGVYAEDARAWAAELGVDCPDPSTRTARGRR